MCGYRFMDAGLCQISLRMMPVNRRIPRGKQCMTGVDPLSFMRQHAPGLFNKPVKSGHFCREMRK
jgi:hypothetical protein